MRASPAVWLTLCGLIGHTDVTLSNPPEALKIDVVVTIGADDSCEVARPGATPHTIACSEVVSYLIEVLKLPKGTRFDVTALPSVDASHITLVLDALQTAGYRMPKVGFITVPHDHDH